MVVSSAWKGRNSGAEGLLDVMRSACQPVVGAAEIPRPALPCARKPLIKNGFPWFWQARSGSAQSTGGAPAVRCFDKNGWFCAILVHTVCTVRRVFAGGGSVVSSRGAERSGKNPS
jgi:hypothetical protein